MNRLVGYAYAVGYMVTIAVSSVWIAHLGQHYSAVFLLLIGTSISAIFFNLVSVKKLKQAYVSIWPNKGTWLLLNIAVGLAWLFSYYCIVTTTADVAIALLYLSTAFFASLAGKKYLKSCLCLMVILAFFYWLGFGSIVSAICGVLSGLFSFVYWQNAASYAKENSLSATQLLAIRFYFVVIVSLTMTLWAGDYTIQLNPTVIYSLLLVAVLNQILPNLFSQLSVMSISLMEFSCLLSLVPLLTFFIHGLVINEYDSQRLILLLAACLVLNYDLVVAGLKNISKK